MTRCDEAALFAVKGVTDQEPILTHVTILGKVRGLQATLQKEGIAPFMHPQLCSVDCRWQHHESGPSLCRSLQATCMQYRVFLQCGRQSFLCPNLPPSTHGRPTLLESGRVVRRPEFNLAPECRD